MEVIEANAQIRNTFLETLESKNVVGRHEFNNKLWRWIICAGDIEGFIPVGMCRAMSLARLCQQFGGLFLLAARLPQPKQPRFAMGLGHLGESDHQPHKSFSWRPL